MKVKNRDAAAGGEPAQECGSDDACAAGEGPQLRRRRAVLTAQQLGQDVQGGCVVADQLGMSRSAASRRLTAAASFPVMAYARARSRLTCVRLPTRVPGMAAGSSASPVSAAVRESPSLSDAEMA